KPLRRGAFRFLFFMLLERSTDRVLDHRLRPMPDELAQSPVTLELIFIKPLIGCALMRKGRMLLAVSPHVSREPLAAMLRILLDRIPQRHAGLDQNERCWILLLAGIWLQPFVVDFSRNTVVRTFLPVDRAQRGEVDLDAGAEVGACLGDQAEQVLKFVVK